MNISSGKLKKIQAFTYKFILNCERPLNTNLAFLDNDGNFKNKN